LASLGSKTLENKHALRVHLAGEAEAERAKARMVLAGIRDPLIEISEAAIGQTPEAAAEADLVIVIFSPEEAAPLGYLQAQWERASRPVMIALLHERSPALMRRALHAGADELLFLPLDETEATQALMKLSEQRRKSRRKDGGVIYSMASLSGGAGVTTLCANLTLALNYALGKGAAVVDLDLQNGGLSLALQVEAEHNIAVLPEFARSLDSIRLEGALTRHPSGIYLLAAPKRIEDAERISDVTVGAVLNLMRQLFDFVIVDCGQRVDENAVAAWERSDEVMYVVDQSLLAARSAKRFADLFGQLGLPGIEPRYVLNKADPQSTIADSRISEIIGLPFYAKIPRDDKLMEKVQLRKQDLWQTSPGSPYAAAIESMAWRLTTRREAQPSRGNGFLARFFRAGEARASA
jgi:pilus assembly protein CpaE